MEIETPDYLSYKAYKKMQEQKKKKQVKKLVFLFLTTFFILLFVFGIIAQQISPHIDLPEDMQEQNNNNTVDDNAADEYKGRVDSRLKDIESQEDGSRTPGVVFHYQTTMPQGGNTSSQDPMRNNFSNTNYQNNNQSPTPDSVNGNGNVRTDLIQKANTNLEHQRVQMNSSRSNSASTAPSIPPRMRTMPRATKSAPANQSSAPVPGNLNLRNKINTDDTSYAQPKIHKVMVGHYNTPSEAKLASEKLSRSNSRINPFIREINGQYTLQVGSYSSEKKATEIASRLRNQNFAVNVEK